MRRDNLVLCQHAIDEPAQSCPVRYVRRHAKDVVEREVGHDALADLPALHVLADRDDLARHVGPGHRVLLLA